MAFTAVATVADAVTAGTAADLAFGTVAAAVGEVGTSLSVVGAVTGNESLSKIGGVMGLAGGIGSMASSAFGGTADFSTFASADSTSPGGLSGFMTGQDATNLLPDSSSVGSSSASLGDGSVQASVANGSGNADAATGLNGTSAKPVAAPSSPSAPDDIPVNKAINGASPASNTASISNPTGGSASTTSTIGNQTGASADPANNAATTGGPLSASTQTSTAAPSVATNVTPVQTMSAGSGANDPTMNTGSAPPSPRNSPTPQTQTQQNQTPRNPKDRDQGGSGLFSGIANWVEAHPRVTQLASDAFSGATKLYTANRQNQIQQGNLQLAQTKQNNLNAQPKAGTVGIGIVNRKGK